ncbi:hypothetical protein [Xanthocytophaga agilis]|uniref:Uncharacterized protein n=1 Tax=Xanthocytophaga agilis TaxID=3048010 RepID=A0AAE3UGJ1_9BACT|nr:hypothetical protein [Xanthocytophaga agilis]MDJ1502532.1 hypothetical protein [Xanthocytophaga agilis]
MKNILFTAMLLALFFCAKNSALAQCEAEKYTEKIIGNLPDGTTFLKSYKIDGEGGNKTKIEYPYIFRQNSTYLINIANKDPELKGVVLELYDANRNLIGTSYDASGKKFRPGLGYTCSATGVYYLKFSFEGSKDYCAAAVLLLKK